jgi:DNA-binding XRE family transcriptional regulator
MERDWVRLGAALRAAREVLGPTQAEMGERIGIGRDAVRDIEAGRPKRLTSTIRAYGRAVGWAEDSVEHVLAGGDPVPAAAAPGTPTPAPAGPLGEAGPYATGMPDRVAFELSDGRILDTDIIDLSIPGSDAKLVLVAKAGASAATDAQKRADLLRWARIQRRVRQIIAEELSHP